jgi:hypothetical protein
MENPTAADGISAFSFTNQCDVRDMSCRTKMPISASLRRRDGLGEFFWVFRRIRGSFCGVNEEKRLGVSIRPRQGGQPVCSGCGERRPGYDRRPERLFPFVPLWGMADFFTYRMRRVDCPQCGVIVERAPWARGKERCTEAFVWFLTFWAKLLSWQ